MTGIRYLWLTAIFGAIALSALTYTNAKLTAVQQPTALSASVTSDVATEAT
ncbi:MAG: hypothetical protein AAGF94_12080 [Pseudomonadota bacterium]